MNINKVKENTLIIIKKILAHQVIEKILHTSNVH
jgi:hypothetical protein